MKRTIHVSLLLLILPGPLVFVLSRSVCFCFPLHRLILFTRGRALKFFFSFSRDHKILSVYFLDSIVSSASASVSVSASCFCSELFTMVWSPFLRCLSLHHIFVQVWISARRASLLSPQIYFFCGHDGLFNLVLQCLLLESKSINMSPLSILTKSNSILLKNLHILLAVFVNSSSYNIDNMIPGNCYKGIIRYILSSSRHNNLRNAIVTVAFQKRSGIMVPNVFPRPNNYEQSCA